MVEIIKNNSQNYNIICEKCNSELKYNEYDIKTYSKIEEYHGELHSRYIKYIRCPVCNKTIILYENEDILK